MNSHSMSAGKSKLREMILLALIGAMMMATQVALATLPNIHLVAVFVILAALLFGWKCLFSVYIFVLLEGLIFGFSMWFVNYLYVWTVLAIVAVLFRDNASKIFWAMLAGIFGLAFGALCAIPYFFVGGWSAAFSYWISGIPFDLIHCVSNAVLTFILLEPLYKLCRRLIKQKSN